MVDRSGSRASSRLNAHRRLMVSLAVFAILAGALVGLPVSLRIAIAWDASVFAFLGLTWVVIRHCHADDMRDTVLANDQGRVAVLSLVLFAIGASVAAIFFLLEKPKNVSGPAALQVALAAATIACSWVLMHVMFALHYAHRFYRDNPETAEVDATR
ncbi:MAG: DUF1345 domain-containing protein, partial [Clostridia bacterium]